MKFAPAIRSEGFQMDLRALLLLEFGFIFWNARW